MERSSPDESCHGLGTSFKYPSCSWPSADHQFFPLRPTVLTTRTANLKRSERSINLKIGQPVPLRIGMDLDGFAVLRLPRQYSRLCLSCLTAGGSYSCIKEPLRIRREDSHGSRSFRGRRNGISDPQGSARPVSSHIPAHSFQVHKPSLLDIHLTLP
jgi:hypothetical protein